MMSALLCLEHHDFGRNQRHELNSCFGARLVEKLTVDMVVCLDIGSCCRGELKL